MSEKRAHLAAKGDKQVKIQWGQDDRTTLSSLSFKEDSLFKSRIITPKLARFRIKVEIDFLGLQRVIDMSL